MGNIDYTPRLENWDLYGRKDGSETEMVAVLQDFVRLSEYGGEIHPRYETHLKGNAYGRPGFNDGAEVMTSKIVCIERVHRELTSKTFTESTPAQLYDMRRCLMLATTESGTKYYFYVDSANHLMKMLLLQLEINPAFVKLPQPDDISYPQPDDHAHTWDSWDCPPPAAKKYEITDADDADATGDTGTAGDDGMGMSMDLGAPQGEKHESQVEQSMYCGMGM